MEGGCVWDESDGECWRGLFLLECEFGNLGGGGRRGVEWTDDIVTTQNGRREWIRECINL